jgi:hypothetical protein
MTSTGTPIGDIDDVTPTAFEEANAQLGSITTVGGANGDFGIRYTLSDIIGSGWKLDMMYIPQHGTAGTTGDQANSGQIDNNTDAKSVALTGTVPGVDGLSIGFGAATKNYDVKTTTGNPSQEQSEGTAYIKYAVGPVTVGAQHAHVSASGLGNATYDNSMYGISYAVSDDLSVSYNRLESRKGQHDSYQDIGGQNFDSISLSYSMGGMTIGIADADCSNCSYSKGRSIDETTVSLSVAF